ncbi:tetratricopeptide repeat protein [Magnetospirillum gryphiswaldense]|uniref:tetratricopeptide repeat protein n=1 Tax=Magnetospirillum gryphiswaldense TaxID=55518 RepID=UPI000D1FE020|nr:tetratricopeptide repeat protein [Magnetospirillum gryphiswaldense]AVM75651.1 tetratricopeptide repeat protein [Magnetospirillum gryphiswaldense MSR-1]AVM79554.1 tetratricopeptide repeat protein [Magnetospirillum gryphiswaldense]
MVAGLLLLGAADTVPAHSLDPEDKMTPSPAQLLASQAHGALQRGDLALAVKLSRQAVAQQPRNPGLNHLAGVVAFHTKDFAAAVKYLRKAAEFRPPPPGVHGDLGQALLALGRKDDAVKVFRDATRSMPVDADAWDGLGNVLMEVNRFDDAIAAFRYALSLAAGAPRILSNLGAALARAGQTEAARETLAEAVRRAPGALEPVSNLATLEAEDGDPSVAKVLAQQVLAKAPHHLVAWIALANAEQKLDNPEEAERLVRQALALHPDNGQVLLSLASVLADLGRNGEAMEFYRHVLRQNRANPKALTGLARAHIAVDEFDAARDLLHEALRVAPDWVASRMELALLEASLGRFEQVAPHWAWRFRAENQRQSRPFPQPAWDGLCRSGQTLVLWAEQGVGDEVLWLSLVPDLLAAGMRLVIECDVRLRDLLCRSFPAATVVARRDPPDPACLEAEAVQSSLAELFLHIPRATGRPGYFRADGDKVARLRRQLQTEDGGKPLIGLSWRSNAVSCGRNKSLSLDQWRTILSVPDVSFVALQYGDIDGDLAAAEAATGIRVLRASDIDIMNDLDGFAALVAAMDKVITTSNTTVHFAGALGVETHVLLPKVRGRLWYYGVNEPTSRWYGTLRLHRQSVQDRWDDVLESVRRAAFP